MTTAGNYNIIGTMKYWTTISVLSVIAAIAVWFMWGLNLGIDFTGGTAMQIDFPQDQKPSIEEVQTTLNEIGIADAHIQTAGESGYLFKAQQMSNEQRQDVLNRFKDRKITEQSYASVGPSLGAELKSKATTALILVLLTIVAYISYVFRNVSKGPVRSWVYGVSAIVSLMHDILVVMGVFIVLGHFFDIQIDSLFVTALLTILGFSVHDTIIVYDRIREELKHYPKYDFHTIVNNSVNNTMARSLNTSLTVLLVLLALYFFGGASIQHFVLALIIGILSGSYSSIFIASPLLLLGERFSKKR